MRPLIRSISSARGALLEAAGLPTALDRLIDQRIALAIAVPEGGPYRTVQPSRSRIEGAVSGLTFDTLPDERPRLCVHVMPRGEHASVGAWFFNGRWYWFEGASSDGDDPTFGLACFPVTLEFPDDPVIAAGRIIDGTCAEWRDALKRFMTDGAAPKPYLDHLTVCAVCGAASDRLFDLQLQCGALDLGYALFAPEPQPPR